MWIFLRSTTLISNTFREGEYLTNQRQILLKLSCLRWDYLRKNRFISKMNDQRTELCKIAKCTWKTCTLLEYTFRLPSTVCCQIIRDLIETVAAIELMQLQKRQSMRNDSKLRIRISEEWIVACFIFPPTLGRVSNPLLPTCEYQLLPM